MSSPSLRSILVASDLGPNSDDVVRAAAQIAYWAGARLHVVHSLFSVHALDKEEISKIIPISDPADSQAFTPTAPEAESKARQSRLHEAQQHLTLQLQKEAPFSMEIEQHFSPHPPFRAILDQAIAMKADLIVMGPHRGTYLSSRLLGSTADRVLRLSHTPCLIVHRWPEAGIRRIGVLTDFSAGAEKSLELGLAWRGALSRKNEDRCQTTLLHVAPPEALELKPNLEEELLRPSLIQQMNIAHERIKDPVVEAKESSPTLSALPSHQEDVRVLWGESPAAEILKWAKGENADLLIAGTHGRSGLSRVLLGSIPLALAQRAPTLVLLVPPHPQKEPEPIRGV